MRAIIILAILGSALAVPDHISRIVGGNATTIETYPFMSNLQYAWFGIIWLQGCGGSLITPNTVLTAAHCVEGDQPSSVRAVLGSTMRSGAGGDFHAVRNIIMHEDYDIATALDSDIAVLHLVVRALLSAVIQTISILSYGSTLDTNLAVTVIGWGTLSYQGAQPENLQHVQVYIIDRELCAARYAHLKTQPGFASWPDVTDNMVCAGILDEGGKDGCQGDSGGPVVYRGVNFNLLVALTSWGYRCADPDYPGVLVNLSRFTNWVVENAI